MAEHGWACTCPHCGLEETTSWSGVQCGRCEAGYNAPRPVTVDVLNARNRKPKTQKLIQAKAKELDVDPKALHVLFSTYFDLDSGGGVHDGVNDWRSTPPELREFAERQGVMLPALELSHRDFTTRVAAAIDEEERKGAVAGFVSSLTTRNGYQRDFMGSFARHLHFEPHDFQPGRDGRCAVCEERDTVRVDLNRDVAHRLVGKHFHFGDAHTLIASGHGPPLGEVAPLEASDYAPLGKMLDGMRKLPASAKLGDLHGTAKGVFAANQKERLWVFEVLGLCGILQPQAVPSFRLRWVRPDERHLSSHFYSNDTVFPLNHWSGADGVDPEAIAFWFPDVL